MTPCTRCADQRGDVVMTFPADIPHASDIAARAAGLDRLVTGADSHIHYRSRGDLFVVVRPLEEVPA